MITYDKKREAVSLRKKGYSYSFIARKTGISKGTLSSLLSHIIYKPNKFSQEVLKLARNKIADKRKAVKRESESGAQIYAQRHMKHISKRDLFMLGIGLYVGEGTKTAMVLRIVNSDPRVIALAVRWFHECLGIEKKNIWARLHIYPDIIDREAKKMWAKQIGLGLENFHHSVVDYRKKLKNRKKGLGTCHLGVRKTGVLVVRKVYSLLDEALKKRG